MKTLIVGGGASGIYTAIFRKISHPGEEITLVDKEEKLGRKLYATGNGHCNLLPLDLRKEFYNLPEFIDGYLQRFTIPSLIKALENVGVEVTKAAYGYYPLSYSASCFVHLLEGALKKLGVNVLLQKSLIDYNVRDDGIEAIISGSKTVFDRLIIATGGASSPNLGSNGYLFNILAKHGYKIKKLIPGLCPVKVTVSSSLRPLAGVRHEALLSLCSVDGTALSLIHEEEGELLYKDDGLSGIAVFNLSSIIGRLYDDRRYVVVADLFPHENKLEEKLLNSFAFNPSSFLDSFLSGPLANEVLRQSHLTGVSLTKNHLSLVAKTMHRLTYEYSSPYPFASSQVTIGGVSLDEIDPSLSSKKEKNVSFVGEALDVDGLCGGYNLAWALISALIAAEV